MTLFRDPAEHAANPPETWVVRKLSDRLWELTTSDGSTLGTYATRTAARADAEAGPWVGFYRKEGRWYAGEPVSGWKPYRALAS